MKANGLSYPMETVELPTEENLISIVTATWDDYDMLYRNFVVADLD